MTASGSGAFFDGSTASSRTVHIAASMDKLVIADGEETTGLEWSMSGIQVIQPFGQGRTLRLSHKSTPSSRLVIQDAELAEFILNQQPAQARRSYAGASFRVSLYICLAAVVAIAALWAAFNYAPNAVAHLLPGAAREKLADIAESSFLIGKRECTKPAGRKALFKIAGRLARAMEDPPNFSVRVFDIKPPNAFAMPNGALVITRGLIDHAESADEVAGVLAHELGHTAHLHPESGFIRALGLQVLLALFTGGNDNLSGAAGLLTLLSYTRHAEREADQFSIELMRDAQVNRAGLIRFFSSLSEQEQKSSVGRALDFAGFLSTHPNTRERIEAIQQGDDWPSKPVLSNGEWRNLKRICR